MKSFPPTTKIPPPKERFKKYRLNKIKFFTIQSLKMQYFFITNAQQKQS
ncbi:hypothetical protein [Helicobacter pylori]|nr:hypothetical protein [Helicobacter pylori]